jgi:hypothetical protein
MTGYVFEENKKVRPDKRKKAMTVNTNTKKLLNARLT